MLSPADAKIRADMCELLTVQVLRPHTVRVQYDLKLLRRLLRLRNCSTPSATSLAKDSFKVSLTQRTHGPHRQATQRPHKWR